MSWRVFAVVVLLTTVSGNPAVTVRAGSGPTDGSDDHPNSVPQGEVTPATAEMEAEELDEQVEEDWTMVTGELNPGHYPAQRAARVVGHHLDSRYGTPFRRPGVTRVHSASAESVGETGRKYLLEVSVKDTNSNSSERCSAEVFFPGGEDQSGPQVQTSCGGVLQINSTAEEEAFYQQHRTSNNLVSGQNLPDSYGYIAPDMKPFWQLGGVASSFIMLKESNEGTLYNMAQVSNFTQLETENDQLRFNYNVLLHDMVSQEIILWKLLATWSPAEGVKVPQSELQPKCHGCPLMPPSDNRPQSQ